MAASQPPTLLAHSFRPFFLLTALFATVSVLSWVGLLFGAWPLPLGWNTPKWHSHEMLYGMVPAAIAGFVLTAATNWTGAAPLRGLRLLALIVLWLAGRLAMGMAGWLPSWLVVAVDLAFLPVLAAYLGFILWRHNNRRNFVLVGILAVLSIGNLLMHIGFTTGSADLLSKGELLGFNTILLVMAVIAGRIIPAFSSNWLRNHGGNPDCVTRSPWTDRLALGSVALLIPLDAFAAPHPIVSAIALIAGLLNGVRLLQWGGWRVLKEPLLWILHLAYAWLVLALILRAINPYCALVTDGLWQHTLGVGAIGTLILGVMTRVSVGHTGRPLKLVNFGLAIYFAITASVVFRLLTAAGLIGFSSGISLSALGWVSAFGLFLVLYWPILSRPRVDGKPG